MWSKCLGPASPVQFSMSAAPSPSGVTQSWGGEVVVEIQASLFPPEGNLEVPRLPCSCTAGSCLGWGTKDWPLHPSLPQQKAL